MPALADLVQEQMGMDRQLALDTVSKATRITVNGATYTGDRGLIPDSYKGMQFTIYSPDRNVTVNVI